MRIRHAAKRDGLKSITAVLTVRATYVDGRRRLAHKKVRIRL
jgi:hypothetical protein